MSFRRVQLPRGRLSNLLTPVFQDTDGMFQSRVGVRHCAHLRRPVFENVLLTAVPLSMRRIEKLRARLDPRNQLAVLFF